MRVILTAAACLAPVLAALKLSLPLPSVWALPVAAALLALVIGTLNARQIVSTALGALMLTVATHQADAASASVAVDPDSTSWPTYDLTNGPLPDDASGFVNVSGFLRPSLKIREFQVEGTQRPDQNEAAHAALMPLVGSREGVIEVNGRIVIARVPDAGRTAPAIAQLRGELVPVPEGIDEVLVRSATSDAGEQLQTVMLDTRSAPSPGGDLLVIGLMLALAILQLRPLRDDDAVAEIP